MGDIKFLVTVDTATGQASLKAFEGEVDKLGGATKATAGSAGLLDSSFVKLAASMTAAIGVTQLAHKAWSSLTGFLKSSVDESRKQEDADMALKSSLAITGREVNISAGLFKLYAEQIQKTTKFSDEQVESAQTLLIQLTHLNRDGIDQATRGSIGLASALGIDLNSAAMMVVKAMEGNYAALGRYGIRVDENLSATEKQSQLLDKLEAMYRRATDAVKTFGGAQDQLKITFGELKESIGDIFTQSESVRTAIRMLKEGIEDLDGSVKGHNKNFIDTTLQFTTAIPLLGELSRAIGWGKIAYKEMDAALEDLWKTQSKVIPQWESMDQSLINMASGIFDLDEKNKKFIYGWGISNVKLGETPMLYGRVRDANKWLSTELGITESKARHMGMVLAAAPEQIGQQVIWVMNKLDKLKMKFEDVAGGVADLFGAWSELSRTNTDAEIARINETYDERKQRILDSLMDEEKKAAMIKNLESDQALAVRKIQREQAAARKTFDIYELTANTAAGFMAALGAKPWGLWNWVQAGLVAAAGAVRIAAIKAQPIPLAKGFEGVVRQATTFVAGEAGPEHLSVHPIGQSGSQIIRISMPLSIYLAGHRIDEGFIEIAGRTSDDGRLRIAPKAIRPR